jgi:hypothetical protein
MPNSHGIGAGFEIYGKLYMGQQEQLPGQTLLKYTSDFDENGLFYWCLELCCPSSPGCSTGSELLARNRRGATLVRVLCSGVSYVRLQLRAALCM